MSQGRFVADTIEAILVGMGESLRETQEALNDSPPLDQFGRLAPRYQIPHIDFEIGFKLYTDTQRNGRLRVFMKPVQGSRNRQEVTTKLSGRFVATPQGDGLPLPALTIKSQKSAASVFDLEITASNSAGEVITNAPIEINFDEAASKELTAAANVGNARFGGGVTFSDAAPLTDDEGIARTRATIGTNVSRAAQIVVSAELGPERVMIVLSKADSR